MTGSSSFVCQYSSTDALCARLNQLGWKCAVGDSYWYGDYVRCQAFPGVHIRIADFPGRRDDGWVYESEIRIAKESEMPAAAVDEAYRKVLAQVPAHDIKEIESTIFD